MTRQIADERRLRDAERVAHQEALSQQQTETQRLGVYTLLLTTAFVAATCWLAVELRRRRILHRAIELLSQSGVDDGR